MMRQELLTIFANVVSVVPAQGIIKVRPSDAPDFDDFDMNAIPLSQSPVGNTGGGAYQWPNVGDMCTVLLCRKRTKDGAFVGQQAYILGYHAPMSDSTRGYTGQTNFGNAEEGDKLWTIRTGQAIWMSVQGFMHFIANTWSRLWLGVNNNEIRGWFANTFWFTKGGRISWTHNLTTNRSKYHRVVADRFEQETDYDGDLSMPIAPLAPNVGYTNKVINTITYANSGLPFEKTEYRVGASETDTLPPIILREQIATPGDYAIKKEMYNLTDYISLEVLNSANSDQIRLNLVPASGSTSTYGCSLLIGRDRLILAHTGDLVVSGTGNISVISNADINIGGEGQEQALATRAFVRDIFMTHTHMGADGAPTTEPLNFSQVITDPTDDDVTNHVTYTTKVE